MDIKKNGKATSPAKVKAFAKIPHEANKAFCELLGDDSQKSWDKTNDANRKSAIVGVQAMVDNPDLTPEESHEIWRKQKEADGWTYGKTKDQTKKTHPSIIDYDKLDDAQKYKDILFHGIVKNWLEFVGHTS